MYKLADHAVEQNVEQNAGQFPDPATQPEG